MSGEIEIQKQILSYKISRTVLQFNELYNPLLFLVMF